MGAAATMTRISDTLLGTESGFRRALFGKGILIRANVLPRFSVNLLDGPVPANQQVYIGQRPTWITGLNPILTADLRQLGLSNAQLHIGAAWRWTTWDPAGPKTIALSTLYLFKMWRDHLIEMKAGYITNDTEFVGMQVGGSLATGAQGVYAVLPYQVGMSYLPLRSLPDEVPRQPVPQPDDRRARPVRHGQGEAAAPRRLISSTPVRTPGSAARPHNLL